MFGGISYRNRSSPANDMRQEPESGLRTLALPPLDGCRIWFFQPTATADSFGNGGYWDDRDSNPDALSSSKFSHHYGFRHHRFSRRLLVRTVPWPYDCVT
jgi:hypothetical protein